MKHPKAFAVLLLLVLLCATNAWAQWSKLGRANKTFFPNRGGDGALCYSAGKLWVGVQDTLVYSTDLGATWTPVVTPLGAFSNVRDISFLDGLNGLLSTSDMGLLSTTDGGKTWNEILASDGDFVMARFDGSTDHIYAVAVDKGVIHATTNGGSSWSDTYVGKYVYTFAIASDHTAYVFAANDYGNSSRGSVSVSTDYGSTWQKRFGLADGDSYTLSVDSCDSHRLYLMNEDQVSSNDGASEIFISTNAGDSWYAVDSNATPYFSGAMATTSSSIFASTESHGVVRSTDQGQTWKSIGGPRPTGDARTLVAIDDNRLVVLDYQGNLWITKNSGGDSLGVFTREATMRLSSDRIILDSSNVIVHVPIYYQRAGFDHDLSLVMHYPKETLRLEGTRLVSGGAFDVSSKSWPGRAELHITADQLSGATGSVVGYADFLWTPFEATCQRITFDSIYSSYPCEDILTPEFFGFVGTVPTCGIDEVPLHPKSPVGLFTFSPNPASDLGQLRTLTIEGIVSIEVFDESGKRVANLSGHISPESPVLINLRHLAAGTYHLRVGSQGIESDLKFVHVR